MILLRWEELLDVADDARNISDDILREENALDGVGADTFGKRGYDRVRFNPMMPPTPFRVKPKLNGIGVNSAEITINNENPAEPSGIFVLMTPIALTEIIP
jgi:hypothetical protein